jgi:hypothetical protein
MFVCAQWINQLLKACILCLTVKSVCDVWPYTEHEPLGIFVVLQLSRYAPWNLWGNMQVVDLKASMREVPEYDYIILKGHTVRELLLSTRMLEGLSKIMVCRMLQAQSL